MIGEVSQASMPQSTNHYPCQGELPRTATLRTPSLHNPIASSCKTPPITPHQPVAYTMADPLSIVASIIGVTAVGLSVAQSLYETISAVADAPASAQSLETELRIICQVLDTLAEYVEAGATAPSCLPDILRQLDIEIRAVATLVDSHHATQSNGIRQGINNVMWTFKSEEISEIRNRIGRYQQLLAISLTLATKLSLPLDCMIR